jgi:hypothetical protein
MFKNNLKNLLYILFSIISQHISLNNQAINKQVHSIHNLINLINQLVYNVILTSKELSMSFKRC